MENKATLTSKDWEEIYYALDSKRAAIENGDYDPCPAGHEQECSCNAEWAEHIERIIFTIGIEGCKAVKAEHAMRRATAEGGEVEAERNLTPTYSGVKRYPGPFVWHNDQVKMATGIIDMLVDLLEGQYGRDIEDAYRRGDAPREELDAIRTARLFLSTQPKGA